MTITAGAIALPQAASTSDDVHKYVKTLLKWSEFLKEPCISISMSEKASEVLVTENLYPMIDDLENFFKSHQILEYDANTVAAIVNNLIKKALSFEVCYKLKDVLTDSLVTNPDIIGLTTCKGLKSDMARCVMLIAILREHCVMPPGGHVLILQEAPAEKLINISAQILEIEHERDDLHALPRHPKFFNGHVLVCDDFQGLIKCLNEATILRDATDLRSVEFAIKIALFKYQLDAGSELDWKHVLLPSINEEFVNTCMKWCEGRRSLPTKILKAITEVILGINMSVGHPLKSGKSGSSPPLKRGNDSAQRRKITDYFRLHYWDCEDGSIELGSIVTHNDYSIPN
jgi:hypothetical protein